MTFRKHQFVNYQNSKDQPPKQAKILEVHQDGDLPYYTIKCVNDTHERQTDHLHLTPYKKSLFNREYFKKKANHLFPKWTQTNSSNEVEVEYPIPLETPSRFQDSDLETIDLDEISLDTNSLESIQESIRESSQYRYSF